MAIGTALGILALAGAALAVTIYTISAIASSGTQSTIITGTLVASWGQGAELQRGRYVYSFFQAANANNQTMTARGITQSGTTLTNSASSTIIFNGTADFDPYSRGQAASIVRLNDTQVAMMAPIVGTGNEFKICTYNGGTNNITIDFSVNDGDTNNYIDRGPKFSVINKPSANVYTIAGVGVTKPNAYPYVRVWDLDTDAETITSRGILYPMGTSGTGNGFSQLVNLGVVGGKHCFAIFYAKGVTATGPLYYAVYEYNSSTNTLVEVVGDTLYRSGSAYITADIPWEIDNGRGVLMYSDWVNYDVEITTCIWDGTTFTVGTPSSFGNATKRGFHMTIRKYYDGQGDSKTQYIMVTGFFNSGVNTADVIVFPIFYDFDTNTWDVSKFDTADSEIVIEDPGTPSNNGRALKPYIGLADKDNGAVISIIFRGDGTFRGVIQNNFTTTNT